MLSAVSSEGVVDGSTGGWFGLIVFLIFAGIVSYGLFTDSRKPSWYVTAQNEWEANSQNRPSLLQKIGNELSGKVFAVVIRTKGGQIADLESVLIQQLIDLGCKLVSLPAAKCQNLYKGEFESIEKVDFILVGTAWSLHSTELKEMQNNIMRHHLDFKIFPANENTILAAHNFMCGEEEWLVMSTIEVIASAVQSAQKSVTQDT